MNEPTTTSTRPYLIRAIHEWCTDNSLTPYLVVKVDRSVQVPLEYVNQGEIVLNVGYDATGGLRLGNEFIEFKARFGGQAREIMVPVDRVQAIYARESGQGMSFPVAENLDSQSQNLEEAGSASEANYDGKTSSGVQLAFVASESDAGDEDKPLPSPTSSGTSRPSLRRIK